MRLLDVFIVLVLLISISTFIINPLKKTRILGAKLYEGNKNDPPEMDTLELWFLNNYNNKIECDISIFINKREEKVTTQLFEVGKTFTNFSIRLPDGKNKVETYVDC